MPLKASLLVIMNEDNAVVFHKIVPNDTKEYLSELLSDIWSNSEVITKAMYTDHPAKDSKTIISNWNQYFDKDKCDEIIVLQDIYHAQNRVLKVMNKKHSDYKIAEKEIKEIIFRVKSDINPYENEQNFKDELNGWITKWKNQVNFGDKYNDFQLVSYLGLYYNIYINCFFIFF